MTDRPPPPPFRIAPDDLADREQYAVLESALVAPADVAVIEVTGPGVMPCIQGLLTNDVEAAGDGCFVYGAVLTPKGMILSDMWVQRSGSTVSLFVPSRGRDEVLGVLGRSLPPRLATFADRTEELAVLRVCGPHAHATAEAAGLRLPDPGHAGAAAVGGVAGHLARPGARAPFVWQGTVRHELAGKLVERLTAAGAVAGTAIALDFARVLAGWPRLGAEIDAKTLPQEVRFDELGGVSYTKGCYTGQETVARVHFRGHPNRRLVGLVWDDPPDPADDSLTQNDVVRGRTTSIVWAARWSRWVGLALARREVDALQHVDAAGAAAQIVDLPIPLGR